MSDRAAVTHFTAPDGRELEITTEMIEVTSIWEPDPAWKYVDDQGHIHAAWTPRGSDQVTYPTLEWVTEDHMCNMICEEDGCPQHRACRRCGEQITPGQRSGRTRFIPGMTSYMINGRHVSPDEAREFVDQFQRSADDTARAAADRDRAEGYL